MKLRSDIRRLRAALGRVFDDNLDTRQWYNVVDWVIVFMIILCGVNEFIATFDWPESVARIFEWINTVTLWFFVVEVSLRIWAAPEQSPRFKGFMGRIRYCFTFYGFIDWVSTYPFLIQYFVPIPTRGLCILRVARIIRVFRITRYAKSFGLLSNSIRAKKNELIVSLQFLLIVTFMLSLILFYYEHEAQPEVYDNGFSSVLWAFAQYIGDPGEFAQTPPVTVAGRVIACIVGILGIAIVAVPAGILGSAFVDEMEQEARRERVAESGRRLRLSFQRKLDRPTGFQVCPPFQSVANVVVRQKMSENDILEAACAVPGFRISNLAATIPVANNPMDRLVVELFECNRPYGLRIDRGSRMTIVATSSYIDPCTGNFAYYLAMIGGFNLVSRELGSQAPAISFYNVKESTRTEEGFTEFMADVEEFAARPGAWTLTLLAASGSEEPEYDTQIHFGTGATKGSEEVGSLVTDKERFLDFYSALSGTLEQREGVQCDLGRYHSTAQSALYLRRLARQQEPNDFVMRVAWSVMLWSPRRLEVARLIADAINRSLLGTDGNPSVATLTVKDFGYT
ncbi:MAG: ion transporter [Candidatus Amulumruptor caecigallinarius]|nr:ion transporter [Candidatus Amulumruptor caecigallinarius]MCM1396779.1 ion transporter [Candidatus Amulumruptor caecigallinarius]MCM1454526.1 ion transporter [bacterium]